MSAACRSHRPSARWFLFGCAFEGGLVAAALVAARLLGLPIVSATRWNWVDLFRGVAGALPLLVVFYWLLETRILWLQEITHFLNQTLRPVFGAWSVWQLALISALAGLGEELLFRAVVQAELTRFWGTGAGLVMASVLFGLVHFVTSAYAVVATLIGLYLGFLWIWSGNLLVPIVTHGLYDLLALVCFLRLPSALLCSELLTRISRIDAS